MESGMVLRYFREFMNSYLNRAGMTLVVLRYGMVNNWFQVTSFRQDQKRGVQDMIDPYLWSSERGVL